MEHNSPLSLKGLRILVAEDHPSSQAMLQFLLDGWSCKTDIVDNGQEAIEKLKTQTYDLCLMDLDMPVLGGVEATRRIRKDLKLTLPILASTGHGDAATKEQCLAVGMNDLLEKPYDPETLKKKMLAWVGE